MTSIGAQGGGLLSAMFQVISPGASQAITTGAASVQAADFASGVTILRVFATQDCWIAFGTSPTAVVEGSSSMFLPAGIVEYFERKELEKIAVIQASTAGKLYITEGSTS